MKTKEPKQVFIYLPKTWEDNLRAKLKENPPEFEYDLDYFKYLGQLPYHIASRSKDMDFEDGYVPVHKATLSGRLHDYRKYLDYLVKNKLLEENKQYERGEYSGSIRYPAKYIKQHIVKSALRKPTLVKSLTSNKTTNNTQIEDGVDEADINNYPYLTKWMSELTIDSKKAHEISKEIYEEERRNPEKYKPKPQPWVDGKGRGRPKKGNYDYTEFRYRVRGILIEKIKNGQYTKGAPDDTTGRFHSILTRMKKQMRKAVKYINERFVSIDIVNSQPYFVVGILDPNTFSNNTLQDKIFKYNEQLVTHYTSYYIKAKNHPNENLEDENSTGWNQNNTKNTGSTIYIDFKNNKTHETDITNNTNKLDNYINSTTMIVNLIEQQFGNEDVKKYIDWVVSGTFYENFGKELIQKKLIDKDCADAREEAKKMTFGILFGKTDSTKRVKSCVKAFKEVFPSVFNITRLIKLGDAKYRPHAALACTMQAFEAEIILKHCCAAIAYERPDLPIFTIHDSIVTTEGNEGYVQSVMEKTMRDLLGYVPQFKVEPWF